MGSAGAARCRGAFSLMEMLVALGVVALLIGLLLPALGRAREVARASASASNLRQIAAVFELYRQRYADAYPIGRVGVPYPVTISGEGVRQSFGNHFDFGYVWPVLVREVAPWEEFWRTWLSPGSRRSGGPSAPMFFSYNYSHAFPARPGLWAEGAGPDLSLLEAVRGADVVYPSSKVLAWDREMAYLLRPRWLMAGMYANPTPMLFADSHVAVRRPAEAAAPRSNPLNPDPVTASQPLHNTPDGVAGRDY